MSDDATKKVLNELAAAADEVRNAHRPGCVMHDIAHAIGGVCRAAATSYGPAQVATEEYRSSWDRTFGGKKPVVGLA